jgi:hypothetical protein
MKTDDDKIVENVILYILSGCAAVIIAALARLSALTLGFDSFSGTVIFIITLAISVAVFLSIQLTLRNLIERLLLKIPYFRDRFSVSEKHKIIIEQPSLEDIRNEQLQNKTKEQEEKLNIALNYTRKTFAPYISDEDIDRLCSNLRIYVDKLSFKTLQHIKTDKDLSTIDILHFGWNIWHHFKVSKQIDVAYFLKKVFPDILKDVEIETIKSHLKDDELKGIIKIRESLSEQ